MIYRLYTSRIYAEKRFIQFPVWFIDTSTIYVVTSMTDAEKNIYTVNCMIYEDINMIYRFQYDLQTIHQYDVCSHQ